MNGFGEIDEQQLVDLARRDRAAFAELYRRHVQAVHTFVRRRTSTPHDADDITAVTFEKALQHLHRYRHGPSGIVGWLYRIAANEIIDQARRRQRQQSTRGQRALRMLHDGATDLAAGRDAVDGDAQLAAALDRLPDRYNLVLSLRYVAGLEPADVAAQLSITPGNCAVLTHRALAALRTELQKEAPR
ncbi:MAG: RNA polymerase sigma factor [Actinomycetota bacterium]|nr:RNA polymerase sigma factor [Actinomycetota bacterium]